ncbi:hypothetical protein P8C59_001320 [Phyllachora maydis]|uniref:Zn(2)-C6 fungal-type domain-containing protein n=1 Tax=Phyllachora maydis TaxID=1825666 RepID=A0AAD9HY69_9PEZI|nr:hypothetical protein P8C59_001320 [Phyllachora maydis]
MDPQPLAAAGILGGNSEAQRHNESPVRPPPPSQPHGFSPADVASRPRLRPRSASDAGPDAGDETAPNPRKRKKASRACDFCHVNHQPCDNAAPRCSVCAKHDRPCLYLRPTKRRGPQKGYRNALNSFRESAAAWGAVLTAIPGLEALVEAHLRTHDGAVVVRSVKEPAQQDALIAKWQASSVFHLLLGPDAAAGPGLGVVGDGDEASGGGDREIPAVAGLAADTTRERHLVPLHPGGLVVANPGMAPPAGAPSPCREASTLSDMLVKDAARPTPNESHILAPLGFAANETIDDFYLMGGNPEPLSNLGEVEYDPDLEQAYYDLAMGGRLFTA